MNERISIPATGSGNESYNKKMASTKIQEKRNQVVSNSWQRVLRMIL